MNGRLNAGCVMGVLFLRILAVRRASSKTVSALMVKSVLAILLEMMIEAVASSVSVVMLRVSLLGPEQVPSAEPTRVAAPCVVRFVRVGAMRWCHLLGPAKARMVGISSIIGGSFRLC